MDQDLGHDRRQQQYDAAVTVLPHRMSPLHAKRVASELAPTIAAWLRENNLLYSRQRDLLRLVHLDVQVQDRASVDPDADFARRPADALATTYSNITFLIEAARAERRRAIENHWTYDLARHSALHRAIDAESQTAIWMERVITIRADIPQKGVT